MSAYSLPAKPEWSTPIAAGATVPSVTFKTRVRIESDDENPFDWKDVTSEDYFKGKRVVLFSLPGEQEIGYLCYGMWSNQWIDGLYLAFLLEKRSNDQLMHLFHFQTT
jgi:hypothetical protein